MRGIRGAFVAMMFVFIFMAAWAMSHRQSRHDQTVNREQKKTGTVKLKLFRPSPEK